jgi:cold shock CspA family protein
VATGIIKSIRGDKGIGYIARDGNGGGERLFRHSSVPDGGFAALRVGQRVSYAEERDPRVPNRFHAVNVRRIID